MKKNVTITKLDPSHWPQVRAIFVEGIEGGNATFHTKAAQWEDWDTGHLTVGRFVAIVDEEVVGWVALSPFSSQTFHSGVVEDSIYVSNRAQGLGVGSLLLQACIEACEANNIWLIQSQIFTENTGSISLHKKFGFKEVGVRHHIGQLNGQWRDVLLMDRRSDKTGIE